MKFDLLWVNFCLCVSCRERIRRHVSVAERSAISCCTRTMEERNRPILTLTEFLHRNCSRSSAQSFVYTSKKRTCLLVLALVAIVALACSAVRVLHDIRPILSNFMPGDQSSDIDSVIDAFVSSIPDNLRLIVHQNASVAVNRPLPLAVGLKLGSADYRVGFEDASLPTSVLRRKYGMGNAAMSLRAIVAGQRLLTLDTSAFSPDENATFWGGPSSATGISPAAALARGGPSAAAAAVLGLVRLRYRTFNLSREPAIGASQKSSRCRFDIDSFHIHSCPGIRCRAASLATTLRIHCAPRFLHTAARSCPVCPSCPPLPFAEGVLAFMCEALPQAHVETALRLEEELRRRIAALPPGKGAAPSSTASSKGKTAGSSGSSATSTKGSSKTSKSRASSAGEKGAAAPVKAVYKRGRSPTPLAQAVALAVPLEHTATAAAAARSLVVSNATSKRSLLYWNVSAQVARARAAAVPDATASASIGLFGSGGAGGDVPSYRVRGWLDRVAGSAGTTAGSAGGVAGGVRALALTTAAAPPALAGRLLLTAGSSIGGYSYNASELANASVGNSALAAGGAVALTALARIAGVTGPLPAAAASSVGAAGALSGGIASSGSSSTSSAAGALVSATALVERLRPAGPALTSAYVCTRDTAAAALEDLRHNPLFREWARSRTSDVNNAGASADGLGGNSGKRSSAYNGNSDSTGSESGRQMSFMLFGIPVAVFGPGGLPAAWAGALLAAALAFFAYAAALDAAAWLLTRTIVSTVVVWAVAQLAWRTGNMRGRAPLGHVLRLALLAAAPLLLWLQVIDPLLPRKTATDGGAGSGAMTQESADSDDEAAAAAAAGGGGKGAIGALLHNLQGGLHNPYIQCGLLVLVLLVIVAHLYDHGSDADAAAAAAAAEAARRTPRAAAGPTAPAVPSQVAPAAPVAAPPPATAASSGGHAAAVADTAERVGRSHKGEADAADFSVSDLPRQHRDRDRRDSRYRSGHRGSQARISSGSIAADAVESDTSTDSSSRGSEAARRHRRRNRRHGQRRNHRAASTSTATSAGHDSSSESEGSSCSDSDGNRRGSAERHHSRRHRRDRHRDKARRARSNPRTKTDSSDSSRKRTGIGAPVPAPAAASASGLFKLPSVPAHLQHVAAAQLAASLAALQVQQRQLLQQQLLYRQLLESSFRAQASAAAPAPSSAHSALVPSLAPPRDRIASTPEGSGPR